MPDEIIPGAAEPVEGLEPQLELEPEPQPEPEPEPEPTWEQIGDNRYRWSDGLVTDAEGNTIAEEPPAPTPPASTPKPSAPEPPPPTVPSVPQAQQIYTAESVEKAVYSDAAYQELADLQMTDPVAAERKRRELAVEHSHRMDMLRQYAATRFDADMRELEKAAPQTVARFRDQINSVRQQLTPEQMQQPGVARYVAAQVAAQTFAADPLVMEEAVIRSMAPAGAPPAPAKPQSPVPPARDPASVPRVIPREERMAGPGTARRAEPTRQRKSPGDDMALIYKNRYPDMTMEEAREYAEALQAQERSVREQR